MKVVIAGASGNLGLFISNFLAERVDRLVLLTHRRKIPSHLTCRKNVQARQVDLATPATLVDCCERADCVISVAGVLFRGAPEKFLPITNTLFVRNLAHEAASAGVKKFVLLSFPHVEGETTPASPATGVMPTIDPAPIHARTRLAAERTLIEICTKSQMRFLILRSGVIYGPGVKLITAAQKMMSLGLLALWQKPTWIHLLSLTDFLELIHMTIESALEGILNLADDQPLLLHDFLNALADHWNVRRPFTLPEWPFNLVAHSFDAVSRALNCRVPLNPDILQMAMMSAVCDTSRLKNEVDYNLKYPTFHEGIRSLLPPSRQAFFG